MLSGLSAAVTNMTGKETESSCELVTREYYSSRRRRVSRHVDYTFQVEERTYTGRDGRMFNASSSLCREGRMTVVYSPLFPHFSYPKGEERGAWMPAVVFAMLAAIVSTLG